jgi:hypothetical protein
MKTYEYKPDGLKVPIKQCSMGRCCNEALITKLSVEVGLLKIVAYFWIFISFILSLTVSALLVMP